MAYGTGVRQSKDDTIMTTNAPDPLDELPDPVAAEAFRRLVRHLRHRHDAQNIELMGLAGFCRNCLSKWYVSAAEERGIEIDYDGARELVYGMPYSEWKAKHQTEQPKERLSNFVQHDHD